MWLIDAVALMEFAHNHVGGVIDCNDIARFPTIEAEPVRHGNWVNSFVGMYACSKCGVNDRFGLSRYCHNCGARMDGGMGND